MKFPPAETDMKADVPAMVKGSRVNENAFPFASLENGDDSEIDEGVVSMRPPIVPSAPELIKILPWTIRLPDIRTLP